MDSIWGLVAQIGAFLLTTFIKDLSKRASMLASFNAFVANRQSRADATVEIKTNGDAQSEDLDALQAKLEKQAKEGKNGKSKSNSSTSS